MTAPSRRTSHADEHRSLELANGLLTAIESPTCALDADGIVVADNAAWREFVTANGADPGTGGVGIAYLEAATNVMADTSDSSSVAEVAEGLGEVLSGQRDRIEHDYPCHVPGQDCWWSVRITAFDYDGARGAVVSHVDITELHDARRTLSHQALDDLTGLPNRMLLADRLGQALADSARRELDVAVGLLDLDRFKRINDSLGRPAGDALLVQVAERLRNLLGPGDTLSRLSGDEFVIVWRDLPPGSPPEELGERLLGQLAAPFELGAAAVNVTASVGVAMSDPARDGDQTIQAADTAMRHAKSRGSGQVRVFSDQLRSDAEERLAVEMGLRTALARSELVLHYQPVIDLGTGRAVSVEALVRWQHPGQGLLGPGAFIDVAESTGLIVPLGRWVLEQACRDAVGLRGPAAGLDVAVNLSVRQLTQPDVVAHVQGALSRSGLDARRLILEVTESAVLEDEELATAALDALTALGVRIAIDDFGTGFSSLLFLRRFPISALKLDLAFVSGIGVNPDDEAICASVLGLAKAVGATSIAEGVETREQYAALRGFGCQQAQGFLWSPAVPIGELPDVLLTFGNLPVPLQRRQPTSVVEPLEPVVAARIASLHGDGASLHTIAAALNRAELPNPAGVRWTANAIARYIAA